MHDAGKFKLVLPPMRYFCYHACVVSFILYYFVDKYNISHQGLLPVTAGSYSVGYHPELVIPKPFDNKPSHSTCCHLAIGSGTIIIPIQ